MLLSKNGKNWKECPREVGEVYGVTSTQGGVMLAATDSGLKASSDQGATWRAVRGEFEKDTIQAICRHPSKPALLFVAKYGVIYTSADAGRSWRSISPAFSPISSVKQLMVVPGTPDQLLILTPQQGVWKLALDPNRL